MHRRRIRGTGFQPVRAVATPFFLVTIYLLLDGRIRHRDPGGEPLRIMTPRDYHRMKMVAENPLMNPPTNPETP